MESPFDRIAAAIRSVPEISIVPAAINPDAPLCRSIFYYSRISHASRDDVLMENSTTTEGDASNEAVEFGERFRLAVKEAGPVKAVAATLGVAVSTMYTWFKGHQSPPAMTVLELCKLAKVRATWVFLGEPPMRAGDPSYEPATSDLSKPVSDMVEVPIDDAQISAGTGLSNDNVQTAVRSWPFPRSWISRNFGSGAGLRIVHVVGDSMEPDLRDGDWLMIDTSWQDRGDGVYALTLDEQYMVKRLQMQGRHLRLVSSNPAYDPIVIDLAAEPDRIHIIGRAVWSGKLFV